MGVALALAVAAAVAGDGVGSNATNGRCAGAAGERNEVEGNCSSVTLSGTDDDTAVV